MKGDPKREERLAAALRENLKRRKARARVAPEASPKPEAGGTERPASRRQDATKRV